MNPGLAVDGWLAVTGPSGSMRLTGFGNLLVLDASRIRWASLPRLAVSGRERRWLRLVAGVLEGQRLRLDVEKGGRVLFSMGSGCRGGLLSWLLGGAAVARRPRA